MSNIKTFKYSDKTQLTKNINISELRCKCSKHHETKYDVDHVKKVQDFMNTNGYDKIIVSSGYRCPAHDKKVGGSGSGQHTKGTAMDVCFYKNGKVVPAKEVCCKAQDFGFKGIGYIDSNYVHLDSRATGTYKGDERKGRSSNVKDFYTYFGITKPNDSAYKAFVKAVQSACGAKVDGIAGTETLSKTVTISATKNRKHKVVKAIQTYLYKLGYTEIGTADGIAGSKFTKAVKNYQKDNGCVVDGEITAKKTTWKKLLKLA